MGPPIYAVDAQCQHVYFLHIKPLQTFSTWVKYQVQGFDIQCTSTHGSNTEGTIDSHADSHGTEDGTSDSTHSHTDAGGIGGTVISDESGMVT